MAIPTNQKKPVLQHDEIEFTAKMLFQTFGTLVLNTKQTAEALGQAEITLKINRANGTGIPYIKLGDRAIRYQVTEIAKYLANNTMAVM